MFENYVAVKLTGLYETSHNLYVINQHGVDAVCFKLFLVQCTYGQCKIDLIYKYPVYSIAKSFLFSENTARYLSSEREREEIETEKTRMERRE